MTRSRLLCIRWLIVTFVFPATAAAQVDDPQDNNRAKTMTLSFTAGRVRASSAAVQAKRMGKSVVIVCPDTTPRRTYLRRTGLDRHGQQGGDRRACTRVLSPGLAALPTDPRPGNGSSAKSMAIVARARRPSTANNGRCGSSSPMSRNRSLKTSFANTRSPCDRDEWLDRKQGVHKEGSRIESITMLSGRRYSGQHLHRCHLRRRFDGGRGRRLPRWTGIASETYGEEWNGVQTGVLHHRHHFGAVKTENQPLPSFPATRRAACWPASAPSRRANTAPATRRSRRIVSAPA